MKTLRDVCRLTTLIFIVICAYGSIRVQGDYGYAMAACLYVAQYKNWW